MYKNVSFWLVSVSVLLLTGNLGFGQTLIDDGFDGGGLGVGDSTSINGGFTLTANSISAASAVAESGSCAEVVTTGGANGNAGVCSNASFDPLSTAALSKGLTVEWVVSSLSEATSANGNTYTLQPDNAFFNGIPYVGVMFSGKAGTTPNGVRFVGKTTGGDPTHNLSALYNYDQASFLDGFTVRFTISETGWVFEVEGLDVPVLEEGSWSDFHPRDVLDSDSFVSAHAQTPGADLVARYDRCTVWIGRKDASRANTPRPEEEAADVSRDSVLAWNPGEYAVTHDVYFATVFDDVNDADRANPLGVLVSQSQDANTYAPGRLEFGQTYYWRVDEVNGAPDNTVFKGDVWSFTVEPLAYPIANVVATSNAISDEGAGPENTVNGSGLNADDHHSVESSDMWLASPVGEEPVIIEFAFDRVYKLHQMLVWNYNVAFELLLGFGIKTATVEYSADGADWSNLGEVQLAQGTATETYAANTAVDFDGVAAQFVRLTVVNGFGTMGQFGLSEIRFLSIPVHASAPDPAVDAADVSVSTSLGWKAGREAAVHDVYLGDNSQELALYGSAAENTLDPGPLDLAATYYWRVDEVNETEGISVWEGPVWNFATQEYLVVDDFESYNDEDNLIYEAWIDGWVNETGSTVGYLEAPFAERSIVHGGSQSMPLFYENTGGLTVSEAELDFEVPQNWSVHGIQSLSLFVYGDTANSGGKLYLKINNTVVAYAGLADVLRRAQWVPWTIDLTATDADLANVRSLTIGIEDTGASGQVFVDDIRLYSHTAEVIEPVLPDDDDPNLVAYYEFEGNTDDSRGNYSGTAIGEPAYAAGKIGQAIDLDNDDDHVVYAFDQEEIWPAYGLSLWVKTDLFAQDQYSGLFNNNSSSADFQIETDGTDPGNYRYQGSAVRVLGPVTSNWVHLAVSCDGVTTHLYYNGLYVATIDVADARFGQIAFGINRGMNNRFGGAIDEVRLYNRALSDAEVLGLAGITAAVPKGF